MFSEKIKELRKDKGISQIEFARQFNISTGTIGNWEIGARQPDYDMLQKIATYFNVSIDYLLGHEKRQQDNGLSTNAIISTTKNEIQALYDAMSPQQQNLLIAYGKGLLADSGIDFTKLA